MVRAARPQPECDPRRDADGFRPIVQVIDNFARNHKLGNLFEAQVGSGWLLVCTIELPSLASSNPAARQLLHSLQSYAVSDAFRPAGELDPARLDSLLTLGQSDVMQKLGARVVRTDSQQPGFEAANILDGDPATLWHTTFGAKSDPFPHEVVIALNQPSRLAGIRLQPRTDQSNGWIKDFRVEFGPDGQSWTQAAGGTLDRSDEEKIIRFPAPVTPEYLKLVAESAFDHQPFASLAEL